MPRFECLPTHNGAGQTAVSFLSRVLPVLLACCGANVFAQDSQVPSERQEAVAVFESALEILTQNYVDEANEREATDRALKAVFSSLDGYSAYMTAEEYRTFDQNVTGEFAGIGAVLEVAYGSLRIIAPIDDGPAARAGVRPGWQITTIGTVDTQGMLLHQAVQLLRGEQDSPVEVGFLTPQGETLTLTLTRDKIRVESVSHRRIGDVGYIRIARFQNRTGEEFAQAIASVLEAGKLEGLVIDLRNNPGGFVHAAIAVAATLLDEEEIVVWQGRTRESALPTRVGISDNRLDEVPVIILINEGTVSAAEILAGALQDHGRAQVVGTHSFGKGLIQTIFPLNGGSDGAISLTTLRYFTPLGVSIQGVGIIPDVVTACTANEAEHADTAGAEEFGVLETTIDTLSSQEGQQQERSATCSPPAFPGDGQAVADLPLRRALDILAAVPTRHE